MSLLGVAVLGKSNEPLYLCDCTRLHHDDDKANADSTNIPPSTTTKDAEQDNDDLFGFLEASASLGQRQSLPLERQFMMHAALDRLEELIGAKSKPDGTMPLRRGPSNRLHRSSSSNLMLSSANNAHWLGLLTVQDGDCAVYGHVVVATNIKFLALVQQSSPNGCSVAGPPSPKTAAAVKKLLASLHTNYINYLMNPFSKIRGGSIDSPRFDASVRETVANYEREAGKKDAS
jgi:hypothetical protein